MSKKDEVIEEELIEEGYKFTLTSENKITDKEVELLSIMETEYPLMMSSFKEMLFEEYLIFAKKQHDYGPKNIAVNQELKNEKENLISLQGLWFRINDKVQRLFNILYVKGKLSTENESIEDSYLDLSVYGKIARLVLDGKWAK